MAYRRLDSSSTTQASGPSFSLGARISKRLILAIALAIVVCLVAFTQRHELQKLGSSGALGFAPSLQDSVPASDIEADEIEKEQSSGIDDRTVDLQSCHTRRATYRALVDNRDFRNTLKWDKNDELLSQPFALAKSQALFSDICWTHKARYGHYSSGAGRTVNECNTLTTTGKRTAVILRLEDYNIFTDDAIDNLRALIIEVAWYHEMDIIVLQNIRSHEEYKDEKVPEEFRPYLINFVNDEIFEHYPPEIKPKTAVERPGLNYKDSPSRYTTTYMQFLQTWFFANHEEYQFAYFFESHVRSMGSYQELFSKILAEVGDREVDLLTLDPIVTTRPSVYWENEATQPESFFRGKFIIHGISRRLGLALGEALHGGTNAAHDAFLPAVAIKNGMNIVMFAHPIAKQKNGLLFETYTVPEGRDFTVLNLLGGHGAETHDTTEDVTPATPATTAWQFGGTFAADTVRWVDDLPQTLWIDKIYQAWRRNEKSCHPGLLLYPVSGR